MQKHHLLIQFPALLAIFNNAFGDVTIASDGINGSATRHTNERLILDLQRINSLG
jgi:hypothetical protein